jgi:PTH1 family peptidyl-tRNA hydrolase
MHVLVGLGNPGPEYAHTRHNIGFLVLEALAARLGAVFGPIADGCRTAEAVRDAETVLLVQPQRYMNRSGEALRLWSARRGIVLGAAAPDSVAPLVICDDIALPLGSVRLRARGSDGGHRGLESVERLLGGPEYPRLRLGVGEQEGVDPAVWADFVLQTFPAAAAGEVDDLIEAACRTLLCVLDEGVEAAGSRHNRRVRPPDAEADQ